MRRTTVRFGRRGEDRRFKERELLGNEGARVSSSEVGAPLRYSAKKTRCCLLFIEPMSSRELGVALRAGLLAALKPRKRVFPLAGCHP